VVVLFGIAGFFLYNRTIEPQRIEDRATAIKTRFIIEEEQSPPPKPELKPVEKKKPQPEEKEEPVDLTKKPELEKEHDDIREEPEKKQTKRPARRIYGIKKVYSTGIGASGKSSDAVVGKLGNTTGTDMDTFTAAKEDLQGELVSITTLSTPPRLKNTVKPEYTPEMIENGIEGIIKAKILVDSDGKVKKILLLNDLGYGSREKAYEAFGKLRFEPAKRNGEPKATWIQFTFRFELING